MSNDVLEFPNRIVGVNRKVSIDFSCDIIQSLMVGDDFIRSVALNAYKELCLRWVVL